MSIKTQTACIQTNFSSTCEYTCMTCTCIYVYLELNTQPH